MPPRAGCVCRRHLCSRQSVGHLLLEAARAQHKLNPLLFLLSSHVRWKIHICIFTLHCNRPLPRTDKRATFGPAVIKLGSAVGAAVPACRHGCSKAAALLLTGPYFCRLCGQLGPSCHKAELEHNLWSTLSA